MPLKDKEARKSYDNEFQKTAYFPVIAVKIRKNDNDFYEGIRAEAESMSITPTEFMKIAAKEKLVRDGYLQENKDAE